VVSILTYLVAGGLMMFVDRREIKAYINRHLWATAPTTSVRILLRTLNVFHSPARGEKRAEMRTDTAFKSLASIWIASARKLRRAWHRETGKAVDDTELQPTAGAEP
jgi:hypothetical protein